MGPLRRTKEACLVSVIKELIRCYDNNPDFAKQGWSECPVSYEIVISSDGRLVSINPMGDKKNRCVMTVPTPPRRTMAPVPACLYEKADYTLGRAERQHRVSIDAHNVIPAEIPGIRAVQTFVASASSLQLNDDQLSLVTAGFGIFRLEGESAYIHESDDFRKWWDHRIDHARWWLDSVEGIKTAQCSVTGIIAPISELHATIKGVDGTGGKPKSSSPTALVAVNIDSAHFMGAEKGLVAQISQVAAHKYATSLNALLSNPDHRRIVGRDTWVWWTDKPSIAGTMLGALLAGINFKTEKTTPQDAALIDAQRELMESLIKGTTPTEPSGKVYLLGMRGSKARIAIVYWNEFHASELYANVTRHLQDMGTDRISVRDLATASVHHKSSFLPSTTELFESITQATQYPLQFMVGCLEQLRTDSFQEKRDKYRNQAQIALIRAYLVRTKGGLMLDSDAYQIGRLMAAIDFTSEKAIGRKTGAYSTAMLTPAFAIPQQRRTTEHRLIKLGGLGVHMNRLIQEISTRITSIPSHTTLIDQGHFALGYDQQMARLFSGEAFEPFKKSQASSVEAE